MNTGLEQQALTLIKTEVSFMISEIEPELEQMGKAMVFLCSLEEWNFTDRKDEILKTAIPSVLDDINGFIHGMQNARNILLLQYLAVRGLYK